MVLISILCWTAMSVHTDCTLLYPSRCALPGSYTSLIGISGSLWHAYKCYSTILIRNNILEIGNSARWEHPIPICRIDFDKLWPYRYRWKHFVIVHTVFNMFSVWNASEYTCRVGWGGCVHTDASRLKVVHCTMLLQHPNVRISFYSNWINRTITALTLRFSTVT